MDIVLLDGYSLNADLTWSKLSNLGNCTFYDQTPVDDTEEIIKRIDNAEIVITHKTPLRNEVLKQVPNLKYIGIMGTGYDVVDIESAHQHDIIVTNVPTYGTDAVAQFTFSLLLEVTGQVGLHNQLIHEGKWSKVPDFTFWDKPLYELKGKTLGLIGYGRIAQKVAELGHAFSMNIIFYNHRPKEVNVPWIKQVPLDELLRQSDVISLHVDLNETTKGLIGSEELALMKPTAFLINECRGPVVDTDALIAALKNKKLAGAALDTLTGEENFFNFDLRGKELPSEQLKELRAMNNVILTPHVGFYTNVAVQNMVDISLDDVLAIISEKRSDHEI